MATKSVAIPLGQLLPEFHRLFNEHPGDVVAMVKHGSERLYELSGLFDAIGRITDDSTIQHLAAFGSFAASDSANLLDERQEQYGNALKEASHGN